MKICAIHQPNFLPWLGFFDKVRRADTFVLLDDVNFSKGTVINRVRLQYPNQIGWLTCPVQSHKLNTRIRDIRFQEDTDWRSKHKKTLRLLYSGARNFATVLPLIEKIYANSSPWLVEFNTNAIEAICHHLNLPRNFVFQSDLGGQGAATEMLIDLIQKTNSQQYLSGGGAGGYQDDALFAVNGIQLVYQNFKHPQYAPEPFTPGLSIVDFLFRGEVAYEKLHL